MVLLQCDRCKKIVPENKIKVVTKQINECVCDTCRGVLKKTSEVPRAKHMLVDKMDELPSRKLFFCNRCQYQFRYNPESSVKLYCPWCGKNDEVSRLE